MCFIERGRYRSRPTALIANICICLVIISAITGGGFAKSDIQRHSKLEEPTNSFIGSPFQSSSAQTRTPGNLFVHRGYFRRLNHNEHTGQTKSSTDNNTGYNKKNLTVHYTSSLMDVWLCLTVAFAWTVIMISSIMPSELEQYSQNAIVIVGHVLSIDLNPFSFGSSAAPTYFVTIDYMCEFQNYRNTPLQIRKKFQTDIKLQQGFANVELLVLPDNPLSGVIKQEWEREYREYNEEKTNESDKCFSSQFPFKFWFGGFVLILSIVGAIVKIHTLPSEKRNWGWLSLVIGIAILWPAAVGALEWGKNFNNLSENSSSAFIVNKRKDINLDGAKRGRNSRNISLSHKHMVANGDFEMAPMAQGSPNTVETRKMSNAVLTTRNDTTTEKKSDQVSKENDALEGNKQSQDQNTATDPSSYYVEMISRSPTGSSSMSSLSCIELRRSGSQENKQSKSRTFFGFHFSGLSTPTS